VTILLTGAAGFIGHHVALALLARGERVVGVDDLNPYYDVALKQARLDRTTAHENFRFVRGDVSDRATTAAIVASEPGIARIVHLAAQAGVRHSLVDPYAYVQANVMGHLVILEAARALPRLQHLVYASSSSVYGENTQMPFRETDRVDRPVSVYAATKRADELMSHAYGHLFELPQTGLRFFTVYGPWGRPDMAYYSFAHAIMRGETLTLYGRGEVSRDFTYVDDIVAGVLGCLDRPPADGEPARILNIGNNHAEPVSRLVELLEQALGRRASVVYAQRPAADVEATFASIDAIAALTGYAPRTSLAEGVPRFAAWFRAYHGIAA
jgi:UDP-glucuronate 4-epimerase